jgi:hypothetical protein
MLYVWPTQPLTEGVHANEKFYPVTVCLDHHSVEKVEHRRTAGPDGIRLNGRIRGDRRTLEKDE